MTDYYEQTSLDTLLLRHNVTLHAVYNCAVAQLDDLHNMEHIFDLKTGEDAKLLATIPAVFFSDTEAEPIIAYFRKEEKDNKYLAKINPDLEAYKVLLLSAFVYNPSFFSMAWNWCVYVQEKARKLQTKPELIWKKSKTKSGFEFKPSRPLIIERMAAATAGNHPFGKAIPIEGVGDLHQYAEEVEGRYHFQFVLSITNEQLSRPFVLEVEFATVKDGKIYHITIEDDPDEPEQTLRSEPVEDIDLSGGIEISSPIKFRQIKRNG